MSEPRLSLISTGIIHKSSSSSIPSSLPSPLAIHRPRSSPHPSLCIHLCAISHLHVLRRGKSDARRRRPRGCPIHRRPAPNDRPPRWRLLEYAHAHVPFPTWSRPSPASPFKAQAGQERMHKLSESVQEVRRRPSLSPLRKVRHR